MKFDDELSRKIDSVALSDSSIFSDLVAVSGLSPENDFRYAVLKKVDFSGSDLSKFDFTWADLRGCLWNDAKSEPSSVRFAMRGRGSDPVSSKDFESFAYGAKKSKNWRDRFLSFALCVDNFGENYLTFDLLQEVLKSETQSYMPACSYLYFLSSYIKDDDKMKYCREMAYKSNDYTNVYRIGKVRKWTVDLKNYLEAQGGRHFKIPGEVPTNLITDLHPIVKS